MAENFQTNPTWI